MNFMEMVNSVGQMGMCMLVNSKKVLDMEKEKWISQMVIDMKVNILMVKKDGEGNPK